MRLKTYQEETRDKLRKFLGCLADARGDLAAKQETMRDAPDLLQALANFPKRAWKKYWGENEQQGDWIDRKAENGEPIPHVCLKLPTGGGKTLLAAEALAPIHRDFLRTNTGLVLWFTPSNAIFEQTKKALAARNHPYRQRIDHAFGNNVRLLTKGENLQLLDVESKLCVMLIMVQASYRRTKDFLKIFKTDEKYSSFFPKSGDYYGMNELLRKHPDLERDECEYAEFPGVSVKGSLVNVLKMRKPVIVMDEGHKTYSELARKGISKFNPSFVLELTATPAENMSNVLVDVKGEELREEEMIKLPIEVTATANADWQQTLKQACECRNELEERAKKLNKKKGRYIRPIMLIRAERTGREQRDGRHIHSEDVKEYLQKTEGVAEREIALKTSDLDELKDILPNDGGLLSPRSAIRYIITKDALKEGWDCPFAYVLALLDNTTAHTALVQMVGRVLRQPDTRKISKPDPSKTNNEALDSAHVFCHNQNAGAVIENISEGLAEEGMKDLRRYIISADEPGDAPRRKIKRREGFDNLKILLPKVLMKKNGKFTALDYEADLLSEVNWNELQANCDYPKSVRVPQAERATVGLSGAEALTRQIRLHEGKHSMSFFCRHLSGVVPNPWQTARIVAELLARWRMSDDEIFKKRYAIIARLEKDLRTQIDKITKRVFLNGLKNGLIVFNLIATDEELYYKVAEQLLAPTNEEDPLLRQGGRPLQQSLFEEDYKYGYNELEKKVALYVDEQDKINWWWRMVSRRDYALQGWLKERIYPDFLVCSDKPGGRFKQLAVAETRSEHLDSSYKEELQQTLEEHYKVGEFELMSEADPQPEQGIKTRLKFPIIFHKDWRVTIDEMLAE